MSKLACFRRDDIRNGTNSGGAILEGQPRLRMLGRCLEDLVVPRHGVYTVSPAASGI